MKLALLSDIHANIQAFEACLAHAATQGAQQHVLLGDLVGYGANPVAVVNKVQALVAGGAMAIKGNHDAGAVAPPRVAKTVGDSTTAWTHVQLGADQRDFLEKLPMTLQHGTMMLVHASADGPDLWRYVYHAAAASASLNAVAALPTVRHVFGGHVHHQSLYSGDDNKPNPRPITKLSPLPGIPVNLGLDARWLATIGSVGQPRDGNPKAMYAVFDTELFDLTFHRVDYDFQAAARAILHAGLPEWLANRLVLGR